MKDDGRMSIGGLDWETTVQSLKDYFPRFGEVIDYQASLSSTSSRTADSFIPTLIPRTSSPLDVYVQQEHPEQ